MSGSDDRVRTTRSLLLRAVEGFGNGSIAEPNRLFNFGFRCSSAKRSKYASSVPKTKMKRLGTWSHDFVCLWSTAAMKPPSCLEIADLIRAGLGRKQLTLIDGDGSHELRREILHTFPRLSEGGGYELLHVAESYGKPNAPKFSLTQTLRPQRFIDFVAFFGTYVSIFTNVWENVFMKFARTFSRKFPRTFSRTFPRTFPRTFCCHECC